MHKKIRLLTLSGMFLAIGLVLPFVTGHIPQIGKMLLPMHIPVLLCGMVCGWQYGLAVGIITPLLRSLLFAMPALYPNATGMAFELATYGVTVGCMYALFNGISVFREHYLLRVYSALLIAMIAGRVVCGIARVVMLGLTQTPFSWQLFLSGAFLTAFPGIILQLVLIPAVMVTLRRAKLIA
ncbi:MAG: ECF transporter S component [Lachnospiraceae bacterium]|nr:ECF transporter S component [Lachnospiraceae bacterium]